MKTLTILLVLFIAVLSFGQVALYAETIYKKDGSILQVKISEVTDGSIWCETAAGDITEQVSIDLKEVDKILNDDGTVSKFSPVNTAPPAKTLQEALQGL